MAVMPTQLGRSGNATLWNTRAVSVTDTAPSRNADPLVFLASNGKRLLDGKGNPNGKCCVATLVASPVKMWVVNVHLIHDDQGQRAEQLASVLGWLDDPLRIGTPALLCGDFNACGRRNRSACTLCQVEVHDRGSGRDARHIPEGRQNARLCVHARGDPR